MTLHLASIHVYPVKGCGGISADTWELDDFGLRHDRRWMIVDAAGEFLTQRDEPRLALVRPALIGSALRLSAPGMPDLDLPAAPTDGAEVSTRVWQDRCDARDAGDDAAAWISTFVGAPFRIVHMPDDTFRAVDPAYDVRNSRVSFADGYPLLLAGAASLDFLNARLAEPLPMNRFRPNVVVAGAEPHEEDRWLRIRIGAVGFSIVKPCARCVVTTIDQETAEPGLEPLRTLADYRRREGKVMFGQNLIHDGPGTLRTGDAVEVESRRD